MRAKLGILEPKLPWIATVRLASAAAAQTRSMRSEYSSSPPYRSGRKVSADSPSDAIRSISATASSTSCSGHTPTPNSRLRSARDEVAHPVL